MNLGEFIVALSALDNASLLPVICEDGRFLGDFESYRGYYDQIALRPSAQAVSAGLLLTRAKTAVGATFEGYKGGDFVMSEDTRLWVSEHGCCESLRPMAVEVRDGAVIVEVVDVGF